MVMTIMIALRLRASSWWRCFLCKEKKSAFISILSMVKTFRGNLTTIMETVLSREFLCLGTFVKRIEILLSLANKKKSLIYCDIFLKKNWHGCCGRANLLNLNLIRIQKQMDFPVWKLYMYLWSSLIYGLLLILYFKKLCCTCWITEVYRKFVE